MPSPQTKDDKSQTKDDLDGDYPGVNVAIEYETFYSTTYSVNWPFGF